MSDTTHVICLRIGYLMERLLFPLNRRVRKNKRRTSKDLTNGTDSDCISVLG